METILIIGSIPNYAHILKHSQFSDGISTSSQSLTQLILLGHWL